MSTSDTDGVFNGVIIERDLAEGGFTKTARIVTVAAQVTEHWRPQLARDERRETASAFDGKPRHLRRKRSHDR